MALTKITSRILDSSGVTILGTIATGVWQGTPINQTYLVGQSGTNTGDETLARINALDVTELGTISSGVWNGTAIASAYLDADTAHLSTTQTFTGAKTFSSNAIFTGNVGIGTASPSQAKLVISPNVAASALDGLTLSYHPDATAAQVRAKLFIDSYHGKLQLTNGSGVVTTHISAGGTNTYFNGSNVGIGTASPVKTLDVQGQLAISNSASSYWYLDRNDSSGNFDIINDSNQVKLTITSGGNVGIGTTPSGYLTSGYVLRLHGGTQTYMAFNNNTHTTQVTGGMVIGNDANSAWIVQRENQPLIFSTNNANRLTISSGGDTTFSGTITANGAGNHAIGGNLYMASGTSIFTQGTGRVYTHNLTLREQDNTAKFQIYSSGGGCVFYNSESNGGYYFYTNGSERMRITSGGEYSFGTPSGVTYSHGSNDGFHLRTGLELGFGNGNNNRPDFGINATGSGGGASLNIYCGEGSDDVDIQIAPNAVMQFNSGGIKFGSSGELLDTYEEGSWVVTLPSSSGASITTYRARYTVVGNVCHFQLYVLLGSIPSNTNGFYISLPITPDSTTNDYTGVSMGYCNNFNTNSWLPITNASIAYIYFHRNDGSSAVITNAQASGLPQLILSGYYYV